MNTKNQGREVKDYKYAVMTLHRELYMQYHLNTKEKIAELESAIKVLEALDKSKQTHNGKD